MLALKRCVELEGRGFQVDIAAEFVDILFLKSSMFAAVKAEVSAQAVLRRQTKPLFCMLGSPLSVAFLIMAVLGAAMASAAITSAFHRRVGGT